jgi:hypothetical protein
LNEINNEIKSIESDINYNPFKLNVSDIEKFKELAGGKNFTEVASELTNVHDPDSQVENARKLFRLKTDNESSEQQIEKTIEKTSLEAVKPFDNNKLRDFVETKKIVLIK